MLYTRFWELKKQYEAGLAEETKKKKKTELPREMRTRVILRRNNRYEFLRNILPVYSNPVTLLPIILFQNVFIIIQKFNL